MTSTPPSRSAGERPRIPDPLVDTHRPVGWWLVLAIVTTVLAVAAVITVVILLQPPPAEPMPVPTAASQ